MALQLTTLARPPVVIKQPLLNEPYGSPYFDDNLKYVTARLFKYVEQTPELVAMLDRVVSDHFLAPVEFFDVDGRMLGPTKLRQVKQFWETQQVQTLAFRGSGTDFFMDGTAFGWHDSPLARLSSRQKEALEVFESFSKVKGLETVGQFAEAKSLQMHKISYLAASTVTMKYDQFGVVYYEQQVANVKKQWPVDMIVPIKMMEWDGKVRGFTPMKALGREIMMMMMLKENIVAQLRNGGTMDHIISLVGANGTSKARFERLRTALESFSHLPKSHGNMPIDAEVKVHPVGTMLKDMEYRELAMFLVSEFALVLGMPTSRIPFMMTGSGGTSNKGELSGNSEDGYQHLMNTRRMLWESAWNSVFRKIGFTFKFRRDNLQDDVRETQALTQRATYAASVQDALQRIKKQLTEEAMLRVLSGNKSDFTQEDIEDAPEPELGVDVGAPVAGQGGRQQPGTMTAKSKVSNDRSASKTRTASNNFRQ